MIIYQENKDRGDIAKRFVLGETKIRRFAQDKQSNYYDRREKWEYEETPTHVLCKYDFHWKIVKLETIYLVLSNTCNLKLQSPNFAPCFLHNVSNYNTHFIVIELGYDSKTISIIPYSKENFSHFQNMSSTTLPPGS